MWSWSTPAITRSYLSNALKLRLLRLRAFRSGYFSVGFPNYRRRLERRSEPDRLQEP